MSDKSNFLQMILEMIIRLLGLSNKTQNSSESQNNNSESYSNKEESNQSTKITLEAVKKEVTGVAKKIIEEEAVGLARKYSSMLKRLNPKQKEFVLKMAELKAIDKSRLTLEESLVVGDLINEAAKLNLKITEELNTFWNKFGAVAAKMGNKFAEIGIRTIVKTLTAGIH